MKEIQEIARIARYHRKRAGLSQTDLAKLADVGKTAVFDLEKGKETIQFDTLWKILTALNVRIVLEGPLMKAYGESSDEES